MRPTDDSELLTAYTARNSEEAFTELVGRYVALVYSAAMRQVGEPHLAEEITQAVFIMLARKAQVVSGHTTISGWLCRVAYFVSRDALRAERRRQHREQIALQKQNNATDTNWTQIAPLLDEAVAQLSEKDRSAIVLRYYEQKSLGEVGGVLGVDADTAQKRVSRALEKLRKFFIKRGVASTTAIIAGAISANSVQAAPVALAKSVAVVAVAKGAAASGSTLTLIKGALKIMAWTKAKTAIVVGVGVLLITGTTSVVMEAKARADRQKDFVAYEIKHRSLLQKVFPPSNNDNETRKHLVGTWVITDKRFRGSPKFTHYPENTPHLKMWTLTNWAIVTYDAQSNTVYSASGPYEIHGDLYTETIETGTGGMSNYVGGRLQYNLRVEGDKYYQMGPGKNPSIEETGQRVQ
jgi:RNA polymerase sigma factor (sigma-70 family)